MRVSLSCVLVTSVFWTLVLHHPVFLFGPVRMPREVRMTWAMIPSLRRVHRWEESESESESKTGPREASEERYTWPRWVYHTSVQANAEETHRLVWWVLCAAGGRLNGHSAGDRRLWELVHGDEQWAGHHQLLRLGGGGLCQQVSIQSLSLTLWNRCLMNDFKSRSQDQQ